MYISALARTLRPGTTYRDFVDAWYPERGFGIPGRGPYSARSIANERELLTIGFLELSDRQALDEGLGRVAEQEAVRHARIDEVIESTQLRGIYEVLDEFDFSSVPPPQPAGPCLAQLHDRQRCRRFELLAFGQRDHRERGLDRVSVDLLNPVGAGAAARTYGLDQLGPREQQAGAVVNRVAGRHRLRADRLVVAGSAVGLAVVVDGVASAQEVERPH
jgi:hypothetical protein